MAKEAKWTNAKGEKKSKMYYNIGDKSKKYAKEISANAKANTGEELTAEEKAYRKGYLAASSDSAYAHHKKNGNEEACKGIIKNKEERKKKWLNFINGNKK